MAYEVAIKFVNWVSKSSTFETYCKNGKSEVKLVDTDAEVKFEHVLLPERGMQVAFPCALTTLLYPPSPRIDINNHSK
jgi:hypothetical protein